MDELLEKILRQTQLTGLIGRVKHKDISLKEMTEILEEYQAWSEQNWERYYQESKFNTAQSMEILSHKQTIFDLQNEIKKLNSMLNENI